MAGEPKTPFFKIWIPILIGSRRCIVRRHFFCCAAV